MKLFLVFYLSLILSICLYADDQSLKYEDIEIKKINALELTFLEKASKSIDFKLIASDAVLKLIKNNSNFDFEDFLIKNERKFKGTSLIDLNNFKTASIGDPKLKETIELKKKEFLDFKLNYRKIKLIQEVRLKAISYFISIKTFNKEDGEFNSYLQPNELVLLKEIGAEKLLSETTFYLGYLKSFKLSQKLFELNHDLPLLSEVTSKEFTVKEILQLLKSDENYLNETNLTLLRKKLLEQQSENIWDELDLSFKLWKDNISYEKYLVDDFCNTQNALNNLGILILNIISKKNDESNKDKIIKLIGINLYNQVFIDKKPLNKLAEFSFDDENTLLKVFGNLR